MGVEEGDKLAALAAAQRDGEILLGRSAQPCDEIHPDVTGR